MKNLTAVGRFFLAIAIVAFGIQHFIYAETGSGFGPPWTPESHLLAYFAGIVFIAAGAALAIGEEGFWSKRRRINVQSSIPSMREHGTDAKSFPLYAAQAGEPSNPRRDKRCWRES